MQMRLWCEDPEIDVKHVLYIQLVSISMGLTRYDCRVGEITVVTITLKVLDRFQF